MNLRNTIWDLRFAFDSIVIPCFQQIVNQYGLLKKLGKTRSEKIKNFTSIKPNRKLKHE